MPGHPCPKTTTTGQPCKNTVATPGGSCGANHQVVDLMGALKASIANAKAVQHAAAVDPMAPPPATTETDTMTGTDAMTEMSAARHAALGAGYQALTPTRFIRGLTAWQAATTLQDAAADAQSFADRIVELRSIDNPTPTDPDPAEPVDGLTAAHLLDAAEDHMASAMNRLRSTSHLANLDPDARDNELIVAQAHALTAAAMYDKAAAEHLANAHPNKIPVPPRAARKAADASLRHCLSTLGDGPLGPQRARTIAETLRVTGKHLMNLRASIGVKQPLTGPMPATDQMDPAQLTEAATGHLTAARDLLAGTSGLTEADKANRATTAHGHVRKATHLLKPLMTT